MCISQNYHCLWGAVRLISSTYSSLCKLFFFLSAILRPKQENQMSIQDRHPTRKCKSAFHSGCWLISRFAVLFFDLLKHYTDLIPPTIARKKRESDRKMPIRKRTAPIDMRVSRSRLSVAMSPKEVFEAQMSARNPNMRPSSRAPSPAPPPVPALPPLPADTEAPPMTATLEAAPALPDPLPAPSDTAGDAQTGDAEEVSFDAPPSFKEPPPEDDVPPRPAFADPTPEPEDEMPPRPPHFASPPPETPDEDAVTSPAAEEAPAPAPPAEEAAPAESPVVVSPPTPRTPGSPARGAARSRSPTGSSTNSSIAESIGILSSAAGKSGSGASLSRSGSGEASRIRGPRGARGPRQAGGNSSGGNMLSITSGLKRAGSPPTGVSNVSVSGGLSRSPGASSNNRLSYVGSGGRSASPVNAGDYKPRGKRGGRANASAFSRRTMASDAEDEVVRH